MKLRSRIIWCFVLAFVGLPMWAAAQSTAEGASQGAAQQAGASGSAAATSSQASKAPAMARPHLAKQPPPPPALADLHKLLNLMRQPKTTPQQLKHAVREYCDKYPTSPYRESAYTLAMRFAQARRDYPDMLAFGDGALKVNPNSLVPLLTLGSVIPQRVHPTDLNREQQLELATHYNLRALAIAQHFPTAYNGHQLAPQQVAQIQQEIRGSAHSSLGVIAIDRGQYAKAVQQLKQAVANDNAQSKPADYYRMGLAQIALKQYPAALASMHQAMTLGANIPELQTLGEAQVKRIHRLEGGGTKAAAAH